jgi:hypothetical protein
MAGPTTYQRVVDASNYSTAGFPLLRRHDGIDDGTATATFAAGTLTSNMDFFCVVRRESAAAGVLCSKTTTAGYFGYFESGSAATSSQAGQNINGTYTVDGVEIPGGVGATAGQLHTALSVGAWHVLEIRNLDLSAFTQLLVSLFSGYNLNGSLGDVVLCPAQTDAVRAKIRRDLARRFGVTLP